MSGYFERQSVGGRDVFVPANLARGSWGDMVRGPAITALLARALDDVESTAGLMPARTTFDLHSPVPLTPLQTQTRVLRNGRRLKLIEADLTSNDKVYARARSLWLKPNADAATEDNQPWHPESTFVAPGEGPWNLTEEGRLYRSAGSDWSDVGLDHQNSAQKSVWQFAISAVVDEPHSPFEIAASTCDVANLATGWGPDGIEFINADTTLSLVRLPIGNGAGLMSIDRTEQDGIAVGTAALFDEIGQFGTAQVTTIFQPGGRLRFGNPDAPVENRLSRRGDPQ
ncbi:MAG: acyl-CoA thioesterase domain-containing protein [Gulosibacter sp.]|uniref:acyl-CoA thioesterase domain-containing protein n=1 Tax=Gulosibacter sp. TaxID=2817531 RepID=UPI003F8EDBDF